MPNLRPIHPPVATVLFVASGLAPRWAAKQPSHSSIARSMPTIEYSGLLCSPTRGKTARRDDCARLSAIRADHVADEDGVPSQRV